MCTSVAKSLQETHQPLFSIGDQGTSSINGFLSIAGKIFFTALAVFALPLLVLQMFLVPLKILLGLKAFALANSILLGSLVAKYFSSTHGSVIADDIDDTDVHDRTDNLAANIVFEPNDYNLDDDNVKRILKFVKEKNKDW